MAGSSSSPSSSFNFPSCSSSRELVSVFADYLKFPFSVSLPKALRSKARGYLFELRRATCAEESHSSFCQSFSPDKFQAAAINFSVHCRWPRQSSLSHAKAPSSLWHGFFATQFQSFLVFAFFPFYLEDIFYNSYS